MQNHYNDREKNLYKPYVSGWFDDDDDGTLCRDSFYGSKSTIWKDVIAPGIRTKWI